MTMSWSHTSEAYENAELNLHDLPMEDLIIIAAEWDAKDGNSIDVEKYKNRVQQLQAEYSADRLDSYQIAAWIWEQAVERERCTNDFGEAYMCPFRCHMVSFARRVKK